MTMGDRFGKGRASATRRLVARGVVAGRVVTRVRNQRWCCGHGRTSHRSGPHATKRRLGRAQSGTRGGHVVDHEHALAHRSWAGPEDRTVQPGRPVEAGLSGAALAFEQTPARDTQLGRHTPGNEFGLVESAPVTTSSAGRCPRDGVDLARENAGRKKAIDQQPGEMMGQLTAVGVLEPQQHIARPAGERHCGDDVTAPRHRRWCRQCEPARPTQDRSNPATPCT